MSCVAGRGRTQLQDSETRSRSFICCERLTKNKVHEERNKRLTRNKGLELGIHDKNQLLTWKRQWTCWDWRLEYMITRGHSWDWSDLTRQAGSKSKYTEHRTKDYHNKTGNSRHTQRTGGVTQQETELNMHERHDSRHCTEPRTILNTRI